MLATITDVQPGNTITLTAPYAVTSGDGLLVGSIFGVAAGTAILGDPVETAVEGVYDLKKVASQAWAAGDKIYWDNTAKNTTKTLTSNTLIGVATEAVAGGATDLIGRVRLNGAF
jgi:predicted RecA/RadA family phage recombinase